MLFFPEDVITASGLSYWASKGYQAALTNGQASGPVHYVLYKLDIMDIFYEYSLKIPQIYLNMLEYFLVGRA
jgi:hypothetical protein